MSDYMIGAPERPADDRVYRTSMVRFGPHPIRLISPDGGARSVVLDDVIVALGRDTFSPELRTVVRYCPSVSVEIPGGVQQVSVVDQDRLNLVLLTSSNPDVWHLKLWAASLLTRAQQAGETFETGVPDGSSMDPFKASLRQIEYVYDQMQDLRRRQDQLDSDLRRVQVDAVEARMIACNDDGFYAISEYLSKFRRGSRISANQTKDIGGWLSARLRRHDRHGEIKTEPKYYNPQDLDEHNNPLPGKYGSNRYHRRALDEVLWPELLRRGWVES